MCESRIGADEMAFETSVARWKEERQRMQRILEWIKSGQAEFGPWSPGTGRGDATADDIDHYRRKIAELDALIARHIEEE